MEIISGTTRDDPRVMMVDGVQWLVHEYVPRFDRRSSATLVFESDTAMRLVRKFPSDWRTLSDEQLFALSWET